MNKIVLTIAVAGILISCGKKQPVTEVMNPFFEKYDTPYEVPPFDKILNAHYLPAFTEGMTQHAAEIEAIAGNAEAPTFANTIEALDRSGDLLSRVSIVFFNVKEAHTNDSLNAIAEEVAPKLSQHHDAILLNETLFARVKAVYENRDSLTLTPEQMRLVTETYKGFVRGGANLPAEKKEELKKINEQLALLDLKFDKNLLAETNGFKLVLEDKADLAGLPENVVAGAAEEAKAAGMEGKWVFTLQKPSWIPFLTYSDKRELREKLYKAMYNRANNDNENDNKEVIRQYLKLRLQKANLMGYPNWASFVVDDNMAKTPENVYNLLTQVWTPAIARAKEEAADIQAMIDREGGNFKLESWDWWYYAEKVRKEKFNLDEEQLRPYFELNNVRDGVFGVANKLYGLTFTKMENMPLFHPECEVYEVKDGDGSFIGVLYMDYFPRASKKGGAWMTNYREQYTSPDGVNVRPVVSITCNFSKPVGDKPSLLSYDEVETLFHEFGHGLHGLLSQCTYKSLAGTNVPRDFVELPSQIMEHWVDQPEVLKMYARHYQTGEVIPQELIDKLDKAGKFNQGFATSEFIAAALLDMDYHTLTNADNIDVNAFELKAMEKIGLISQIIPRYRSTYFAHIFSWGYSSGYYAYTWSEVLDADAFEAFKEAGNIFDPAVAKAFRSNILEKGGTEDPMKLYLQFRGKEPNIQPLLKNRGLN
ncbi:MAG TPA: M3 family metallopeptidase [Prolixibacteraceae bacterium]|nr:M3 family metallopeptidase [Bacteroidales bacterium]OQB81653.1 MAG: Peptidyl-dipeptidase dcp [Bacteroidetes bacterium ADurb.Bin123]HNZ68735.1 M3 family metallopeptidase [Prolixibacteraceae bacterium]HOC87883.1 M3 family metallopeptidase [Prolixibacteraceae bacterium]HOG95859.1 M3 family metallopeptidase [Prolixibacteraceae bacterium]